MRKLDYCVQALMLLLVVASAFAFGSVHPFAYRPLEAALFGLTVVWCVKLARSIRIGITAAGIELPGPAALAIPMVALAGWTFLQIVPLPPAVIGALSPHTYQLYARALDGWPQAAPYLNLNVRAPVAAPVRVSHPGGPLLLPTRAEVPQSAAVSFASGTAKPAPKPRPVEEPSVSRLAAWIYGTRWRPLALAPVLTFSSLLVLMACGCAFLLTAFYPFGDPREPAAGESRFIRTVLRMLLATGFVMAFVGLIERATWNGKLLWFFIPYDWGKPMFDPLQRACGPFVDPDHFAGYLAVIFPLALACAVFPNMLTPRRASAAFRVQCCVATFVIFVAVLLSLSRAGWLGLMVGTTVMFMLALPGGIAEIGPESVALRLTGPRLALLGIIGLLCAAVMFIGPDARVETAARFNDTTLAGIGTIGERIATWKGGLGLVRDFPLFGVGLGGWPEIFSRYRLPPWFILYADEAHNDYLQLLTETGIIGVLICGWIATRVLRAVAAGWRNLTSESLPVMAAIIGGIAAMSAIEFFDFDLRIPGIGLLMAIMAGSAIRIARIAAAEDWEITSPPPRLVRTFALAGAAAASGLIVAALIQNRTVYPYNLHPPRNLAEARAMLLTYPADSFPHLALATRDQNSEPAVSDAEFARAAWLDPLNPRIRDQYARELVAAGKPAEALEQIQDSLLYCPVFLPQNHPYLIPRLILWFPPALRDAVEKGLVEAVDRGYEPAPRSLGDFYSMFGRWADEARMYAKVGEREDDPVRRADYFEKAGEAYARAGDPDAALAVFKQAADEVPDDSTSYADMAVLVYGPRHDLASAQRIADQGIENGADPYLLSVAVGDAALAAGDRGSAENAYERALKYRPDAYDLLNQLSNVYALDGRVERAILTLNRAVEVRPDSAETYFQIGQMQEGRYRYYEAEQAYRQAVKLSPNNPQYQEGLAEFERKMKAESAAERTAPSPP